MAVPVINIVIEQGVDYEDSFIIKEPDGSLIDLTGQSGTASIKKHPTSSSSVNFTVGLTTSSGTVTLSMGSSITNTLDEGRYYYDVILTTNNTGRKTKIINGMVKVNPSITV